MLDVAGVLEQVGKFVARQLFVVDDDAERGIGFRAELAKPVFAAAIAISLASIATATTGRHVATPLRNTLDGQRHAHAAADAEGGEAAPRLAFEHFVKQRHGDARSGAADGMAECNGTAPFTLSFSRSKCSSRSQASTWAAKASIELNQIEIVELEARVSVPACECWNGPEAMRRGSTPAEVRPEFAPAASDCFAGGISRSPALPPPRHR